MCIFCYTLVIIMIYLVYFIYWLQNYSIHNEMVQGGLDGWSESF